jgi:hypothetical protein
MRDDFSFFFFGLVMNQTEWWFDDYYPLARGLPRFADGVAAMWAHGTFVHKLQGAFFFGYNDSLLIWFE